MKIFKMIRGFFLKRSRSYKIMQNVIFHVKLLSPTLITLIFEVAPEVVMVLNQSKGQSYLKVPSEFNFIIYQTQKLGPQRIVVKTT